MPDQNSTLNNLMRAQQKFISNVLATKKKDIKVYRMDDYPAIRKILFDGVKSALAQRFPLYNDRYTLSIEDIDYDDPEEVDIEKQKRAILEGSSITRRLRGTWVLRDAKTDKEVSRTRRMTLMNVPYITDRGTFIRNGHEYAFSNIMRMEPGVYTKQRDDEISAQFNIQQGTGTGFNMYLMPNTGVFRIKRGTTTAPAYTFFHDMGITDDQMKDAWGQELFDKNKAAGTDEKAIAAATKIYNM